MWTSAFCILLLGSEVLGSSSGQSQRSSQADSGAVEDRYVVKYLPGTDQAERERHESQFNALAVKRSEYEGIVERYDFGDFQGYYIHADSATVEEIRKADITHVVEQDTIITADFVAAPPVAPSDRLLERQSSPPPPEGYVDIVPATSWGLARISHRNPGQTDYLYKSVRSTVYVVDTGIMLTHDEFQGPDGSRAIWGVNYIAGSPDTDENGHGTHVSGTIGGNTYGITNLTTLVACKVFDKNAQGPWSNSIGALQWAVNDAAARNATGRSLINMSLGGARYEAMNAAAEAAYQAGLAVVVAAGNSGVDANDTSPASAPDAITVAATDAGDNRPSWSNFGSFVDIFAPGDGITSSWIGADNASMTLSGTSMACPHVTGLCAYFIDQYGAMTPDEILQKLTTSATAGKVVGAGESSPNLLAYNANGLS